MRNIVLTSALLLASGLALFAQAPDERFLYRWSQDHYSNDAPMLILEDLDADGFDEVLLSDANLGRLHVMSGRSGVPFYSTAARGRGFGNSAVLIPDQNGDGRDDLAIGSPGATSNSGLVYIIDPRNGSVIRTLTGPAGASGFGYWLDRTSDFDGDSMDDLLVTDPAWNVSGVPRGAVFVYSSRTWTSVYLLSGIARSFGAPAMDAGDRDLDGKPELLVAAPLYSQVGLFSSRTGLPLMWLPRPATSTPFFGSSIAVANLDGDGVPDFIVSYGSSSTSIPMGCSAFSGSHGAVLWSDTYLPSSLRSGHGVQSITDQDRDGRDEVLVGNSELGRVTCRSGATGSAIFYVSGQQGTIGLGAKFGTGGDVNGDGVEDFLAADWNPGATAFAMTPLTLVADRHGSSYAQLQAQRLALRAGAPHAGKLYLMLGSLSGITPGLPTSAGVLPLNFDFYFDLAYSYPNIPPFVGFRSLLDATGSAEAIWQPLPGYPEVVGLRFDHAFAVIGPSGVELVSNSVPLTITP